MLLNTEILHWGTWLLTLAGIKAETPRLSVSPCVYAHTSGHTGKAAGLQTVFMKVDPSPCAILCLFMPLSLSFFLCVFSPQRSSDSKDGSGQTRMNCIFPLTVFLTFPSHYLLSSCRHFIHLCIRLCSVNIYLHADTRTTQQPCRDTLNRSISSRYITNWLVSSSCFRTVYVFQSFFFSRTTTVHHCLYVFQL